MIKGKAYELKIIFLDNIPKYVDEFDVYSNWSIIKLITKAFIGSHIFLTKKLLLKVLFYLFIFIYLFYFIFSFFCINKNKNI